MFKIEAQTSKPTVRLGTVLSSKRQMVTPNYTLGSVRGSTPHLTPDLVETLPGYRSITASMGDIHTLVPAIESYKHVVGESPFHKMSMLRDDQSLILSLRSPTHDLHYLGGRYAATPEQLHYESNFPYPVSNKVVAINTDKGAIRLSPEEYLKQAAIIQPDILLLAGQPSDVNETKSRAEKTMRRNVEFIDTCLHLIPQIFSDEASKPLIVAPIEGGQFLDKRTRHGRVMGTKGTDLWIPAVEPDQNNPDAVKAYKDKLTNEGVVVPLPVDGFLLGGIGSAHDSQQRCELIQASLHDIPRVKLTMTQTTGELCEIVDCILNGIDITCITYPLVLADEGLCIIAPITIKQLQDVVNIDNFSTLSDHEKLSLNIMNLRDDKYIEDPLPISSSCHCYTCKNHSRSYISHLLNTHEMLAEVLLMCHNMYQYDEFYKHARSLLNDDCNGNTSILDTWKDLSKQVYIPHAHTMERNNRRKYAPRSGPTATMGE